MRDGASEIDHLRQLRLENPGVEGEIQVRQLTDAGAEILTVIEAGFGGVGMGEHARIGVVCADVAHAAETPRAHDDVGLQDLAGPLTEPQVHPADDPRAGAEITTGAAGGQVREAIDCFRLAKRAQLDGAVGPVEGGAVYEDRRHDVVAAQGVGRQLVEQIPLGLSVRAPGPQMVVGVDDRQVGLEDGLGGGRLHLGLRFDPSPRRHAWAARKA